jgi:arabinofuranosyltransferase
LLSRIRGRHAALAFALLIVGYTTVVNAWCGDDPYITFRAIDNAVHGWGLVWNPYERVQVFTDPLWALLLTGVYALTGEAYFTTMFASVALSVAVVGVIAFATRERPWWTAAFAGGLLVASKAYVDYSTSGLENPLTHLLVALFYTRLLFESASRPWTERRVVGLVAVASLVYLNRADAVLAVVPGLAWALWRARGLGARALTRAVVLGGLPVAAWTTFSLVYYGFPFPNTAYAKLNGGRMLSWFHQNGVAYFANSLTVDRFTLPLIGATIVAGTWLATRRRDDRLALLPLAGAAAYLVYTMRIGGDYMSGRLFALPLLLSVLALAYLVRTWQAAAGVGLAGLVATLFGARPPIVSPGMYETIPVERTGIRDERGDYYVRSGLMFVMGPSRANPGRARYPLDQAIRADVPQATIWGAIGYYGFSHGPQWFNVDNLGLSDPLLARLPGRYIDHAWGRGHLFRDLPAGYLESVEMNENRIVDPSLHEFFDHLRLVTTGPIWRWDRFKAIWAFNTGKYRPLLEQYAGRTPTAE